MQNGPWCHVTICNQLSVCSFEDYFTTGFKDRFKLMYDVDAYEIMYPSGIETAISVGDRPLKSPKIIREEVVWFHFKHFLKHASHNTMDQ